MRDSYRNLALYREIKPKNGTASAKTAQDRASLPPGQGQYHQSSMKWQVGRARSLPGATDGAGWVLNSIAMTVPDATTHRAPTWRFRARRLNKWGG